jgi:hypothetical protein
MDPLHTRLATICEELVQRGALTSASLIDRAGRTVGFAGGGDVPEHGALTAVAARAVSAAGGFDALRAGEPFEADLEGDGRLLLSLIARRLLLLARFDPAQTPPGDVRRHTILAREQLESLLAGENSPPDSEGGGSGAPAELGLPRLRD